MKRSITYKGIKEVVYILNESSLNEIVLDSIKKNQLFIKSNKGSHYSFEWCDFEWCDTENGRVYLEVTQKIIESVETE